MPDYSGIDLEASAKIVGHLFDLEVAIMTVMEEALIGSTRIHVSKIGKCWIGTDESNCMTLSVRSGSTYKYFKVKDIDYLANTVILYSAITEAIPAGTTIFETLYVGNNIITYGANTYIDVEQACLGALDGIMRFTDLDVPVLTITNGKMVPYMPFPVQYNEVSTNSTGKLTDVTITLANIDQLLSTFVLLRSGLRKSRMAAVYTVHLDAEAYQVKHINIPTLYEDVNYYICNTNANRTLDTNLNRMINYVYVLPDNVVGEFTGRTKAITLTDKTVAFTIMNSIDDGSSVIVPRRTFTRTKCSFLYKDEQCRFKCNALLEGAIPAELTTITLNTTEDKQYLYLEQSAADMVIRIDDELIKISRASNVTVPRLETTNPKLCGYSAVRGVSGTTAAAHSHGAKVDIIYCKKTEQDCIARCNYVYQSTFPAIPKNTGESNGTVS